MTFLTSKEKKWSLLFLLPGYFVVFSAALGILFGLCAALFFRGADANMVNAYFNLFYDSFMMVLAIWVYRDFLKKSTQKIKQRDFKEILKLILIGFVVIYASNLISGIVTTLVNKNASSANQDAVVTMAKAAPAPMLISVILVAPVLEELIFRVGIFTLIYPKSKILAYLASGLAFGFVHIVQGLLGGDMTQLIFLLTYSLMGMVLCYFYEKSENIYIPIMVHMLNNGISMLLIFLF